MKVLLSALGIISIYVATYTYLLLPLDLGLGLSDGYRKLGPLSFGVATSVLWLVLIGALCLRGSRVLNKGISVLRRVSVVTLCCSIAMLTSYPLVVLYMYTALDSVMETGQVNISGGLGSIYWWLLPMSAGALLAATVGLLSSFRSDRRAAVDSEASQSNPRA